jgi:UDP-N-acetylglucosamine 2-epimerase (non-hydrolysing)
MLDQVLSLFRIRPDYDLNLMVEAQSISQVASAIMSKMEQIFSDEKPDWLLVQGDTTTVAAAALAAFYCRVRVAHVEAGLRTFNSREPFPEEVNRRVASVVADLHFAPTERARINLLQEGVAPETVFVTGNTVVDTMKMTATLDYDPTGGPLSSIPWQRDIVMVTAHRRESFGSRFEEVCSALREIAVTFANTIQIVYPVHPNPCVREPAQRYLGEVSNISLVDPLDYLPFHYLMRRAKFVITDSGGIQEEAPSLGKPVLVLRDLTERPEAVDAGTARLVGTSRKAIVHWARLLLENAEEYDKMAKAVNPYGDGHAAKRIIDVLGSWPNAWVNQ